MGTFSTPAPSPVHIPPLQRRPLHPVLIPRRFHRLSHRRSPRRRERDVETMLRGVAVPAGEVQLGHRAAQRAALPHAGGAEPERELEVLQGRGVVASVGPRRTGGSGDPACARLGARVSLLDGPRGSAQQQRRERRSRKPRLDARDHTCPAGRAHSHYNCPLRLRCGRRADDAERRFELSRARR